MNNDTIDHYQFECYIVGIGNITTLYLYKPLIHHILAMSQVIN
jgi:hypothetical protein